MHLTKDLLLMWSGKPSMRSLSDLQKKMTVGFPELLLYSNFLVTVENPPKHYFPHHLAGKYIISTTMANEIKKEIIITHRETATKSGTRGEQSKGTPPHSMKATATLDSSTLPLVELACQKYDTQTKYEGNSSLRETVKIVKVGKHFDYSNRFNKTFL